MSTLCFLVSLIPVHHKVGQLAPCHVAYPGILLPHSRGSEAMEAPLHRLISMSQNMSFWGWRNFPVVKSSCCSCSGLRSNFQCLHSELTTFSNSSCRRPIPFSGLLGYQACMRYTCIHAGEHSQYKKKNNFLSVYCSCRRLEFLAPKLGG